ncbi:MAG: hypothetical protein KAH32_05525, partial [Chlamydiia bacterium]|nr:hypothetical protein [Chlamydiia bacterium]
MSDLSNIKDLNLRLIFKGKGNLDGKASVDTYSNMQALVIEYFEYFSDGDIIWVKEEKAFYTLKLVKGSTPYFNFEELRLGSKGIIWGAEDDIYQYNVNGNPDYAPSLRGYRDGEVIVVSEDVYGGMAVIYKQYDIFRIDTISDPEVYEHTGESLIGSAGADGGKGDKGDKGDMGDSFTVNAQGPLSDRSLYCDEGVGFSFFATDVALIYFKLGPPNEANCLWTVGTPFGKGDPGTTPFFVYLWKDTSPSTPAKNVPNIPSGWWDSPGSAPKNGEFLWSSQTSYRASTADQPLPGEVIIWSNPVQVNGDKGLDGREGIDAGFWVIWSDKDVPDQSNIPKPKKGTDGKDTWTQGPATDWVDDIVDIPDQKAKWMASVYYNTTKSEWMSWSFSKIAGEQPSYKINLFARRASAGAAPTATIPYMTDGLLTTGAQAAILAGGDWEDGPMAGENQLFFTEIIVAGIGVNNSWSTPVQLDGKEGKDAGIFTIWADAKQLPTAPKNLNTIFISPDGIDLSTSPGWYDDIVNPSDKPIWMATSMWRYFDASDGEGIKWQWSNWKITKTTGEDGSDGGQGRPGKSGGTVIMFSVKEALDEMTYTEPNRPTNEYGPTLDPSELENLDWINNVEDGEAIFLAVMTFGQTTSQPNGIWSSWRISKMKGEDGEDGATVPPGSAIFSNVWGSLVEEGWSIASGGYNAGFAGNLPGGTSKLTGPATLPLAIYGGKNYLGIPVTSTPTHTETFGQIEINYRAIWYPQAAQLIFSTVDGLTVTLHAPSDNQSYISLQGGYNITSNDLTKQTFYDGDEYWGKMYALKTLGGPWLLDNVPAGTGSFLVSKIFNEFDNGYDIIQDVRVANSISGQTQRKTLTYLLVSKSSNTLYVYAGVNGISQNDTYGTWPIITEKYDFALAASTVTYYDRSDSQLPTNESAITYIKYPQFAYEIITKYSSAAKATSYEVMWSYTKASATSPNTHTKMFTDAPGTEVKLHTQGSQLQINSYIYVQVRG